MGGLLSERWLPRDDMQGPRDVESHRCSLGIRRRDRTIGLRLLSVNEQDAKALWLARVSPRPRGGRGPGEADLPRTWAPDQRFTGYDQHSMYSSEANPIPTSDRRRRCGRASSVVPLSIPGHGCSAHGGNAVPQRVTSLSRWWRPRVLESSVSGIHPAACRKPEPARRQGAAQGEDHEQNARQH